MESIIRQRTLFEPVEDDTESKIHPKKHSFCVSLRRDAHWKSLILSVLIYGCLGAIVWCRLAVITTVIVYYNRYVTQREVNKDSPCADGYIYIPVAFVILLYLVYLVECWHCNTRIELKHKTDVQTVYHKMRQMREALPIVWWKAVCYHYVRRTRQVTRYRNGDAFTSTQVYYERVNTHTSGCAFNFTNCGFRDLTKHVTGLEDYAATKIRFSKSYSFANPDSKYEFDDQRNQFFISNERRDEYMETREGMDLLNVNFKEYMVAFKDPDNLPWYVSNLVFWAASFLLLSWPLRVIIEYKTAHIHYHVHKEFGTNYTTSDNQSTVGTITRVNTIASAELEMIVRSNFTVVPSYSEALLMNADATSTVTLHDNNANVTSPVCGPTRSITWNNITSSQSSGYISGFFSTANIPNMERYSSCTLVNDGILVETHEEQQRSRTSLRSMITSPWTRKRKTQPGNRMFVLSSPDSQDEYSMTLDNSLSAACLPTDYSSKDVVRQKDSACGHMGQPSDSSNPSSSVTGYVSKKLFHHNSNKKYPPVMQTGEHCTESLKLISEKASRPSSIATNKQHLNRFEDEKTKGQFYVKSNLPNVPISSILSESCSSTGFPAVTPSSPPCYAEAVHMHRPSDSESFHSSERQSLLNGQSNPGRNYRGTSAIMETSL